MASNALEANSPNWLAATVVAADVFMANIFIDIVGKFKESIFVMRGYTIWAEIVVGCTFRLISFAAICESLSAVITLQPQ